MRRPQAPPRRDPPIPASSSGPRAGSGGGGLESPGPSPPGPGRPAPPGSRRHFLRGRRSQEPAQGGGGGHGGAARGAPRQRLPSPAAARPAEARPGRPLPSGPAPAPSPPPAARRRHLRGRSPRPSCLLRLLLAAARGRPGVHRAPRAPRTLLALRWGGGGRRARGACARHEREGERGRSRALREGCATPADWRMRAERVGERAGIGQSGSATFRGRLCEGGGAAGLRTLFSRDVGEGRGGGGSQGPAPPRGSDGAGRGRAGPGAPRSSPAPPSGGRPPAGQGRAPGPWGRRGCGGAPSGTQRSRLRTDPPGGRLLRPQQRPPAQSAVRQQGAARCYD